MKGVRFVIRPEGPTVASDRRGSFRKDLLPLAPCALVYDPPGREPKNRRGPRRKPRRIAQPGWSCQPLWIRFAESAFSSPRAKKRSGLALNRKMGAID